MNFIQYFKTIDIKKLVFSFLFILLCPIIVLAFSSYHTASTSLNDQIMQSAKENVEQLDKNITKVVKVKQTQPISLANGLQRKSWGKRNN